MARRIKLTAFGRMSELLKANELVLDNCSNIMDLKSHLEQHYPSTKEISFLIAVNKKVVHENIELNGQDEIALLPPYSGG
jgi:sulfur-carrier protein